MLSLKMENVHIYNAQMGPSSKGSRMRNAIVDKAYFGILTLWHVNMIALVWQRDPSLNANAPPTRSGTLLNISASLVVAKQLILQDILLQ